MGNPCYTKALFRLLLSLPFLVVLFVSSALPSLVSWSRLYAPNWTETFASLEPYIGNIDCCIAFILMCIHYHIYLDAASELRHRILGTDTLLAFATLSSFFIGSLPYFLDFTGGAFLPDPFYASTMSALISFGAVGQEFPSFFHLIGLWIFFFSIGNLLRIHSACLLEPTSGADIVIPDSELRFGFVHVAVHVMILALLIAVLTCMFWTLLGVSFPFAASFFLFLLVSAVPCALPLAEALPLWVGIALLNKRNVSLRSFRAVEAAALSDTLVLGKSDILTRGEPQITDIIPEGITLSALMSLAAAAESGSHHPIARAISEYAIRLRAKYGRIAAFNESPGEGVEVLMSGSPIRVGQKKWIESQGVRISANLLTKDDQLAEKGKTILYVSNGKNAKGIIAYEYELDEETAETVQMLAKQNVETILMINDGPRTAKAIAKQLEIPNYRYGIHPGDLTREIQLLQAHGRNVALFANLTENSPPMKQADCLILPRFVNENRLEEDGSRHTSSFPQTIIVEVPSSDNKNNSASVLSPSIIVNSFSVLPFTRILLKKILSVMRMNTIFSFLGPLLILPASSGILVTMGYSFPAPWLISLAMVPGLVAAIFNTVQMGRQLSVIDDNKTESHKEAGTP